MKGLVCGAVCCIFSGQKLSKDWESSVLFIEFYRYSPATQSWNNVVSVKGRNVSGRQFCVIDQDLLQ
jgi:N-acetylneuraminic acid mutarotase